MNMWYGIIAVSVGTIMVLASFFIAYAAAGMMLDAHKMDLCFLLPSCKKI